jgi:FkbM family methyltransferase
MIIRVLRNLIDRYPAAALAYRTLRDQLDRRKPTINTPWGFLLAGHRDMAIGNFEPEETKFVRELLQDVGLLINVGANIGYYCCHALSMGKPVIAVEPVGRNIYYLLKNIHDNGWSQHAQIFPLALGASPDILEMWGGDTGASLIKGWASIPESYVTRVPVLTLDRILGDTLRNKRALILVDIEGAEYMMLQGATQTLMHDPRPIWMVEITATDNQPPGTTINPHFVQTFDMFFQAGYKAYTADVIAREITADMVRDVVARQRRFSAYNFVFR